MFTNKDFYRDPNGLVDVVALQRNINVQRQLGYINADLEIAPYVDLGLVKDAAQRLNMM